jgi:hypothetical protein
LEVLLTLPDAAFLTAIAAIAAIIQALGGLVWMFRRRR